MAEMVIIVRMRLQCFLELLVGWQVWQGLEGFVAWSDNCGARPVGCRDQV